MKIVGIEKEWSIIGKLLRGFKRKAVAREEDVSVSYVAKTKRKYPLFFWNSKRRYKP